MRTMIVHQPIAIGHIVDDIKSMVTDKNLAILRGNEFPGMIPFLSIEELIGDPDHFISDDVCDMLTKEGVLSRTPVMDANGRQAKIKLEKEELLWSYTWGPESLLSLTEENLSVLAWDLRRHPNFVHVSVVNDVEEVAESVEESLDSEADEEYDDSETQNELE